MTVWTDDELVTIGTAEELEIASLQADSTPGKPTTIWVVRVGDHLYVRPVNGHKSDWFRGTQVRHEGQITAGGIVKDVTFSQVDANDPINDQIDTAYWEKYPQYPQYVPPVVTPKARAATLELVPRTTT